MIRRKETQKERKKEEEGICIGMYKYSGTRRFVDGLVFPDVSVASVTFTFKTTCH